MTKGLNTIKVTATLENWHVRPAFNSPDEYVIEGAIRNDVKNRFLDGTEFSTSGINKKETPESLLEHGFIVFTRNSIYLLGKPS